MAERAAGHKVDEDGGERLRFIEEISPLDTPLHVHENEDEVFYVLEGDHVIQVGDEEFHLGPGGLVFGPSRVPHAQRRVVPRTGRILIMTSPAGFEGFFRELAEAATAGPLRPPVYARVSDRYGITWL